MSTDLTNQSQPKFQNGSAKMTKLLANYVNKCGLFGAHGLPGLALPIFNFGRQTGRHF